jgi:uncharacterized protein
VPGVQARRGVSAGAAGGGVAVRVAALDWPRIERDLDERGHAATGPLLTAAECHGLIAIYSDEARFRSRVDMARHRFGEGEYKYFAEPLPPLAAALRRLIYPRLAPLANRWMERLGSRDRFPADLAGLREQCARHGQRRPTPLLLHYVAGGFNCLHQDIYGRVAFPLQLTCLLSAPGKDFAGGEFLVVEQRPRQQSRGDVVPLERGDAVVFATRHRPAVGRRGDFRVTLRHGVSRVVSGERWTLGVIFHDAE